VTPPPGRRARASAAATAECIVRDGLAQVRMASIARTAGVSSGLLHYHFDTKEQLFSEVLRYSHGVSADLSRRAMADAGEGPAQRLSSFLDRCLPSDDQRRQEWLLWQELDLLCIRDRDLAQVAADLYEDLYVAVARLISQGVAAGVFHLDLEPRLLGETAVALTDGLGTRVLARELHIEQARTIVATSFAVLVGHDGPLPSPTRSTKGRPAWTSA
jgi:AcrR family transcriptional regulator